MYPIHSQERERNVAVDLCLDVDFYLEVEVQPELERLPLFSVGYPCRGNVGVGMGDVLFTTKDGGLLGVGDFGSDLRRRHDCCGVVSGVITLTKVAFIRAEWGVGIMNDGVGASSCQLGAC